MERGGRKKRCQYPMSKTDTFQEMEKTQYFLKIVLAKLILWHMAVQHILRFINLQVIMFIVSL